MEEPTITISHHSLKGLFLIMREEGMTQKQMAKTIGLSQQMVSKILNIDYVIMKDRVLKKIFIEWEKEGLTHEQIAEKIGLSEGKVFLILHT